MERDIFAMDPVEHTSRVKRARGIFYTWRGTGNGSVASAAQWLINGRVAPLNGCMVKLPFLCACEGNLLKAIRANMFP